MAAAVVPTRFLLCKFVPDSRTSSCRPIGGINRVWNIRKRDLSVSCASSTPSPDEKTDDVLYIAKLLAGCAVAAGVIKYGSLIVPEITEANLVQALGMILGPVALSVVALVYASSTRQP